jgi:hypothetical protein
MRLRSTDEGCVSSRTGESMNLLKRTLNSIPICLIGPVIVGSTLAVAIGLAFLARTLDVEYWGCVGVYFGGLLAWYAVLNRLRRLVE